MLTERQSLTSSQNQNIRNSIVHSKTTRFLVVLIFITLNHIAQEEGNWIPNILDFLIKLSHPFAQFC